MQCERLVLLDVMDGSEKKDPRDVYQAFLAACFLLPTWLGTWYLRRQLETRVPHLFGKLPLLEKEREEKRRYVHSTAAYPYYYMLRRIMTGGFKDVLVTSRLNEFDGVPILFMDAQPSDKPNPMRFYTDKFKKYIDSREDCEFVAMDASHWIMWDKPKQFNEKLLAFIQK